MTAREIAAVLRSRRLVRGGLARPRDQLIANATSAVVTRLVELGGPLETGRAGEAQVAIVTTLVTGTVTALADGQLLATEPPTG